MKSKIFLVIFFIIVFLNLSASASEKVYSVYDQNGHYIFSTSIGISIGDRYINELNREYKIIEVKGQRGTAKFLGVVDLLAEDNEKKEMLKSTAIPTILGKKKLVGIYHTHTGECYLPQEVVHEGYGDIYEVGSALANDLHELGIQTIQSWESHLPHDASSYDRSRTTAVNLLQEGASAIFDLHRDGVPMRDEYITMIGGQVVSQVRLVVGRQNPNMKVNDQMAKRIKAYADGNYPGLIKGIFYADGKYNQDLSPQAMLLEMGTHVTTKEEAIASTKHLADVLAQVLYGAQAPKTRQAMAKSALKNAFVLLLVTSTALTLYLYISTGSWEGVKERMKHFVFVEFKDILETGARNIKNRRNQE